MNSLTISVGGLCLTRQQEKAAYRSSARGDVVVSAGAGTGKTRTLVARAKYLVEVAKVSPEKIACVTFTNEAARELDARLEAEIGDAAQYIRSGTIHALALKAIESRRDHRVTVIDPVDGDALLKQCAADLGYYAPSKRGGRMTWRKGVKWGAVVLAFEKIATTTLALNEDGRGRQSGINTTREIRTLLTAYMEKLDTYGAEDIRLLVSRAPKSGDFATLMHVLVDESQDVDAAQWAFLQFVAGGRSAFFVVGDDRQRIYEWRGAHPGLVEKAMPESFSVGLTKTHRCSIAVTAAANSVARDREPLVPRTDAPEGLVHVQRLQGPEDVERLMHGHGVLRDDCTVAVLARTRAVLEEVEEELEGNGIRTHRIGRLFSITDTEEFRRVLYLLRIIANERDALAVVLSAVELGFSPAAMARAQVGSTGGLFGRLLDITSTATRLSASAPDTACSDILDIVKRRGRDPELWMHGVVSELCSANIAYGGSIIDFWRDFAGNLTVRQALRRFELRDDHDDRKVPDGHVCLATIHGVKGLEFDHVYLVGFQDGLLPHKRAETAIEIEAERRLLYVAVTRARLTFTAISYEGALRSQFEGLLTDDWSTDSRNPYRRDGAK